MQIISVFYLTGQILSNLSCIILKFIGLSIFCYDYFICDFVCFCQIVIPIHIEISYQYHEILTMTTSYYPKNLESKSLTQTQLRSEASMKVAQPLPQASLGYNTVLVIHNE